MPGDLAEFYYSKQVPVDETQLKELLKYGYKLANRKDTDILLTPAAGTPLQAPIQPPTRSNGRVTEGGASQRFHNEARDLVRRQTEQRTEDIIGMLEAAYGRIPHHRDLTTDPANPAIRSKLTLLAVELDNLARRRIRAAVRTAAPLVVREYAAQRPGTDDLSTSATLDTVLWQPVIVLPSDGKMSLQFTLGNADSYEIIVAGHTLDGRIGAIRTVVPVAPGVQPAMPTPVRPAAQPGSDKR
jgi:hypothetical protein